VQMVTRDQICRNLLFIFSGYSVVNYNLVSKGKYVVVDTEASFCR
jgi:hypothetical protein